MAQLKNLTINDTGFLKLSSGATSARQIQIYDLPGSYSFTVPAGVSSMEVLVVGGGGGGGQVIGGGGGAGGLIYNSAYAVSAAQTLTVTVGGGGAGAVANNAAYSPGVSGSQGGNSVISGGAGGTLTATGGGGGANYSGTSTTGGSGGGGGAGSSSASAGTAGQGNAGASNGGQSNIGGGGGGAGGAGISGISGGTGGAGLSYSITGISKVYAAGGGGGVRIQTSGSNTPGAGGSSNVGGAGASSTGGQGTDGTGSGGGAGGWYDTGSVAGAGGRGGHGTVILRWGTTSATVAAAGALQFNTTTRSIETLTAGKWVTAKATKLPIPRDQLQLYYDFSDPSCYPGTGTTVFDLSGNQWNGTLQNTPVYSGSDYSAGTGVFTFNGSNTRISTAFKPVSGARSYFLWIYHSSITGLTNGYGLTGTQEGNAYSYIGIANGGQGYFYAGAGSDGGTYNYYFKTNQWYHQGFTMDSTGKVSLYVNGQIVETRQQSNVGATATNEFSVGCINTNHFINGRIGGVTVHQKELNGQEVKDLFNADSERFGLARATISSAPDGTFDRPFGSPYQAQGLGFPKGQYYFKSGTMAAAILLEFIPYYAEGRPWCLVFRSGYRRTASINRVDLNIPMAGLLVQKDSENVRAAVYWAQSTPITYNTTATGGNNTADYGYSPRRVILGRAGGHGIFRTDQDACSWGNSSGAVGAGYDGSTCGAFPNDLVWGIGDTGGSATYGNRNGSWSHWVNWNGDNFY